MRRPKSLKRLGARLSRFPRSHGFGVQSPSDYRLVTHTLRAALPEAVLGALPRDRAAAKLCRIVYRVVSSRKPATCVVAGCPEEVARIVSMAFGGCVVNGDAELSATEMVIAGASWLCARREVAEEMAEKLPGGSCMVVAGIRTDKKTLSLWRRIAAHEKSVVTFDLYSSGIVLRDEKRYPQAYKIYV